MKSTDSKVFYDIRNGCCKIPSLLRIFPLCHLQNVTELGKGREKWLDPNTICKPPSAFSPLCPFPKMSSGK